MPTTIHGEFYDLAEIKDIPILDVCSYLGIDVQKQGKNYWCRVRPENTPSVILHTDTNTFYDFGNGRHGSCVDLVSYATGKSFPEAVQALGHAFGLAPLPSKEVKQRFRHMSRSDYARIGLHSDLATKNFTFPVEHFSLEKLAEIESRYQMSMNDLKKQHPKVYERIIREKAVPYVDNLRNLYYLNVWNYYSMLRSFHKTYLFYDSNRIEVRFDSERNALKQAERSLSKACLGTSIVPPTPSHPDPFRIIRLLEDGRLSISIGSLAPEQMIGKTATCTLTLDTYFHPEMDRILNGIPHSAILSKDSIEILCNCQHLQPIQDAARTILSSKATDDRKAPVSFYIESSRNKINSASKAKRKVSAVER